MTKIIAVSGKGGTGKTTFVALLIRQLCKHGSVLAVDADPNFNLNELLGVRVNQTIGNLNEEKFKEIPSGFSKHEYMKLELNKVLIETDKFDLIVMGRSEGPGCYCYQNNIIRDYVDMLEKNYDFVVIDNEAGLEHLSRKTTGKADVLFILSDNTNRGLITAHRVIDLVNEVKIDAKNIFLIINRINGDVVKSDRVKILGEITVDSDILSIETSKKTVFDISDNSNIIRNIDNILKDSKILQ